LTLVGCSLSIATGNHPSPRAIVLPSRLQNVHAQFYFATRKYLTKGYRAVEGHIGGVATGSAVQSGSGGSRGTGGSGTQAALVRKARPAVVGGSHDRCVSRCLRGPRVPVARPLKRWPSNVHARAVAAARHPGRHACPRAVMPKERAVRLAWSFCVVFVSGVRQRVHSLHGLYLLATAARFRRGERSLR